MIKKREQVFAETCSHLCFVLAGYETKGGMSCTYDPRKHRDPYALLLFPHRTGLSALFLRQSDIKADRLPMATLRPAQMPVNAGQM